MNKWREKTYEQYEQYEQQTVKTQVLEYTRKKDKEYEPIY